MSTFEKSFRSRCEDIHTHMTVSDEGEGCLVLDCSAFHIPGGDLGAFTADLAGAAGKPEPVILERPRYDSTTLIAGTRFSIRHGGVEITRYATEADSGSLCDPGTIRAFAASLAILADEAENEPGPAEVEELTRILRGITPGMAYPGEGDYKTAVVRPFAEAALRWMRGREAKP